MTKNKNVHFEHILPLSVECVLREKDVANTWVVTNDWAILDLAAPSERDRELQF